MSNFNFRGVLANLITLAILLACLFIPAGTLDYWQAWVFLAVFGVSAQALGIYFLVHDRKLVERRMTIGPAAEQRPAQKFISALFILGFMALAVLPAFDYRFGWSPVAPVVSVLASAMIVLRARGYEKVILVGWSGGGSLSLFIRRRPKRRRSPRRRRATR